MQIITRNTACSILVLVIFSVCIVSCAKKTLGKDEAIVINNYSIKAQEFNTLLKESGATKDTPEIRKTFLERLITRKLLLQEAQKEGLDKEKPFLKSIEHFWEQSLLKVVIDKKVKELSNNMKISEEEVNAYYDKWAKKNPDSLKTINELRESIKRQLLKVKQANIFNLWIDSLRKEAGIKINKKAIGIE